MGIKFGLRIQQMSSLFLIQHSCSASKCSENTYPQFHKAAELAKNIAKHREIELDLRGRKFRLETEIESLLVKYDDVSISNFSYTDLVFLYLFY